MKINFFKTLFIGLFIYTLSILYLGIDNIRYLSALVELRFWILSLLVPLLVFLLLSIRWLYFLRYLNYNVNYIEAAKIYLPALSLIAAPARSGEAIRGIWLKSRFNIPSNVGVSITLVERIGDLLSATIIIIAFIFDYNLFIILLLLAIVLFLSLLIKSNKFLHTIRKSLSLLNILRINVRNNRFYIYFLKLFNEARVLCSPSPLSISVILSLLAWLLESYLLFFLFTILNVDIPYKNCTLIRTAMGMGGVISFLPAGLLTTESTAIGLSIAYGSGYVEAFAATIFIRIYTLFIPFGIGLLSLLLQKDLGLKKQ